MLKISPISKKRNLRIKLPEAWHEIILEFTSSAKFPYNFVLERIEENPLNHEIYYIFKSKKDRRLALSEPVLQYFFGEKVKSSNEGLSFKNYLPIENSKLLITNSTNPSEVIPAKFVLISELIILKEVSMIGLNFRLNYLHGNGFSTISNYSNGSRSNYYKWRFILHPDQSYMSDYEKLLCDTLIHKDFVERSCAKLIKYLEKEGAYTHAKLLRERAKTHDNSKLTCEDEIEALSKIINDKSCLTDAAEQLSQAKINAIKLHWSKNPHHPEFYKTPLDMSKIDIMEMCCDWHARSIQYDNDFLPFVEERQKNRFHFPEFMYKEILHYCMILATE